MAETPASPVPDPAVGQPVAMPDPERAFTEPPAAAEPTLVVEPAAAEPTLTSPSADATGSPVPAASRVVEEPPAPAEPPAADLAPAIVEPAVIAEPPAWVEPPAAPEPAVAAQLVDDAEEPRVATTLEVPPLPAAEGGAAGSEGGEWDLLMGKVTAWLERADLPGQWERLGGPLRGLGVLLGVLLVLKLYVALLDTLDDLLLLPRLLQLVGLIALLRFSVTRLTRSSDRQQILDDWKRRWDAFRGS